MKLFLDECVDRRLARHITEHDVKTARQMGWTSIKNGELLKLASAQFDAFITVDRNLSFQQSLPNFMIAVIVLSAKTNRLADLIPLIAPLNAALETAPKGAVTTIRGEL